MVCILSVGLIIFSFCFEALALMDCKASWTIKNEINPSCVSTGFDQADSGWCFLFSANALIQQKTCISNGNKPDKPSLRGVLARYNDYTRDFTENKAIGYQASTYDWSKGANSFDVLTAANGAKVASEKCAPTLDLLMWADKLPKNSGLSVTQVLEFSYHQYLLQTKLAANDLSKSKCEMLNLLGLNGVSQLSQFASDIVNAVGDSEVGNSNEFMSKVIAPPRCESDPVVVPKYSIQRANPSNAQNIEEVINNNLKKERIVSVSVCPAVLKGKNEGCGLSGHQISVVGFREKCCGNFCHKEYRILDSQTENTNLEKDRSEWIAADYVVKGIQLMQRRSNEADEIISRDIQLVDSQIQKLLDSGVDEFALQKALERGESSDKIAELMFSEGQDKLSILKRSKVDLLRRKNGLSPIIWLE